VAATAASANIGRRVRVVRGEDTRQDSVANALLEVESGADLILVHGAVRPLVTLDQIERVIADAAARFQAILRSFCLGCSQSFTEVLEGWLLILAK
jgi:2-C-methyl-D-erythritol 4-phosphate cytidylyltransferase